MSRTNSLAAGQAQNNATGTCPVCYGTGRTSAAALPYATSCFGYDYASDTIPCTNCGGHHQHPVPTGRVPLRPDGTPCRHDYIFMPAMSRGSLRTYRCILCNDTYSTDSGD